jgi:hypothetical protein
MPCKMTYDAPLIKLSFLDGDSFPLKLVDDFHLVVDLEKYLKHGRLCMSWKNYVLFFAKNKLDGNWFTRDLWQLNEKDKELVRCISVSILAFGWELKKCIWAMPQICLREDK